MPAGHADNCFSGTPAGMSPVYLDVGAVSKNGVTILGHNGFMFIEAGSNLALQQFEKWSSESAGEELSSTVDGWLRLFETRQRELSARGVIYLQSLIPEKHAIFPQLLPDKYANVRASNGELPTLSGVSRGASGENWYIDALALFRSDQSKYLMWPRTGSHWTPAAARLFSAEVIRKVDASAARTVEGVLLDEMDEIEADLAGHLLGPGVVRELMPAPDGEALPFGNSVVRTGGNVVGDGKWSTWVCEDFLVDRRIMVFGNSYMQVTPMTDRYSWWLSRVFRESHFVWSPEVDYSVVEAWAPDIVLAQGIERFLPRLPRS